jgi:hypothetical protein
MILHYQESLLNYVWHKDPVVRAQNSAKFLALVQRASSLSGAPAVEDDDEEAHSVAIWTKFYFADVTWVKDHKEPCVDYWMKLHNQIHTLEHPLDNKQDNDGYLIFSIQPEETVEGISPHHCCHMSSFSPFQSPSSGNMEMDILPPTSQGADEVMEQVVV